MQFAQHFSYEMADGTIISDPIFLNQHQLNWISTLSPAEQDEYILARTRQQSYRQQAIDAGKMFIKDDDKYVWSDYNAMKIGKPEDPIWRKYFDRYLAENNMKLVTTLITL